MNSTTSTQNYRELPQEIQELHNFVLYQHHVQDGEVKKRPYDWLGGKRGNDDPVLRLPLADAVLKIGSRANLGLAIYQPSDGIKIDRDGQQLSLYILDCDGFLAEIDGKLKLLDQGWTLIEQCSNTYTELSVSHRGVKILCLTDMAPQKKLTFKLPPNEFADIYPNIKKYRDSHAVEVFSAGFWNVITGEVIGSDFSKLQFVPKEKLQEIFDHLNSLAPQDVSQERNKYDSTLPVASTLADKLGLIKALSKIDNQTETTWNDVAWSLARMLGIDGLELFVCYSRGDYNGKPYPKYSDATVRDRYRRALDEVRERPQGFGLSHLSKLSGIPLQEITRSIPEAGMVARCGVTASELATKTFPPLEWVIEGVLPEGCYLLSARPKVGKSWLALQICLGVAFGEEVLNRKVKAGVAVYLALEDNERRLQSRLEKLRPTDYSTDSLILHTEWRRFSEGGTEDLIDLIKKHQPRIVVIDTLAKVRPLTGRNHVYESDYAALAPITAVANRFRTTVLIVHHNRKGKAETDPLEQVSGSLGLSGAVDGVLVIDGNRGDASYTLSLIGRDIPNDQDLAISLADGRWTLLGSAKQVFISQERQAIRDLLILHPKGLKPKEISELTGKRAGAVRKLLVAMANDMQLENTGGMYSLPSMSAVEGNIGNAGDPGNSGNLSIPELITECIRVTELPELPVPHE